MRPPVHIQAAALLAHRNYFAYQFGRKQRWFACTSAEMLLKPVLHGATASHHACKAAMHDHCCDGEGRGRGGSVTGAPFTWWIACKITLKDIVLVSRQLPYGMPLPHTLTNESCTAALTIQHSRPSQERGKREGSSTATCHMAHSSLPNIVYIFSSHASQMIHFLSCITVTLYCFGSITHSLVAAVISTSHLWAVRLDHRGGG